MIATPFFTIGKARASSFCPKRIKPVSMGSQHGTLTQPRRSPKVTVMLSRNHMSVPRNQHVITENLLQRFAGPKGFVKRTFLDSGRSGLRHPNAEGFIPNFISTDAQEAEDKWNEIERQMPTIYAHIENKSLLSSENEVSLIKRFMALHIVRSFQIQRQIPALVENTQNKFEKWLRNQKNLDEAVKTAVKGAFHPEFQKQAQGGTMFKDILFYWYEFIGNDFQQHSLEIGIAEDGQFILGDTPVVMYDKDTNQINVGINPANLIFMPVGVKHVISLLSSKHGGNRYRELDVRAVEKLNELTQRAAIKRLYSFGD